jgi:hypothetical protein
MTGCLIRWGRIPRSMVYCSHHFPSSAGGLGEATGFRTYISPAREVGHKRKPSEVASLAEALPSRTGGHPLTRHSLISARGSTGNTAEVWTCSFESVHMF